MYVGLKRNNDPLEKVIEKKVCDYAKRFNHLCYKFTSPNRASVPDRLLITPGGKHYFIEFKRRGKKPTPSQSREIARLIANQSPVFIVDNIDDGLALIDLIESGLDMMNICNGRLV